MAVSMTLHQLYSQQQQQQQQQQPQAYDDHHHHSSSVNVDNNSAAATNTGGHAPPQSQSQQGRTKSPDRAASGPVGDVHYDPSSAVHQHQHQHPHHPHATYQVAPSHYQQPPHQQQQHYGYSSQYQGKSADDYAADPLPFEYHGVRKYAESYSQAPHHPAAYSMGKNLDSRAPPPSHGSYAPHYQPHPSDRSHYHPASEVSAHFPHASHHPQQQTHHHHHHSMAPPAPTHMFSSQLPLTHSFPPLIDPKKEPPVATSLATSSSASTVASAPTVVVSADVPYAPSSAVSQVITPSSSNSGSGEYASASLPPSSAAATGSAAQEAMIKVKTPLKTKYWRNGRRNLQCFPSCKVFGDYSAIKIEDLKQHDFMWGKCRGSIVTEVTLNSSVSFDDIVILGRVHSLENIPVAFEEAVIRECMLGRMVDPDVMDTMKDQWISGERLPDFVQQDGHTACFEFKPKVWKYTEDMAQGKCKRRNVKYYVQFEAFVLVMAGERRYYACIGSGMSTSFEVGSSRVLARQKRKAATSSSSGSNGSGGANPAGDDLAPGGGDLTGSMQPMHHAMMVPPHGMMGGGGAPSHHHHHHHSMAPPSGMFQSAFHHPHAHHQPPQHHVGSMHESLGPARGLPGFAHAAHMQQQQVMTPESSHLAAVAPVPSSKRKASSDRQAYPAERASKMLKPMAVPM